SGARSAICQGPTSTASGGSASSSKTTHATHTLSVTLVGVGSAWKPGFETFVFPLVLRGRERNQLLDAPIQRRQRSGGIGGVERGFCSLKHHLVTMPLRLADAGGEHRARAGALQQVRNQRHRQSRLTEEGGELGT